MGEAADAAEAVAVVARLRPQVVLLDIQLPDRDGTASGHAPTGASPTGAWVSTVTESTTDLVSRRVGNYQQLGSQVSLDQLWVR